MDPMEQTATETAKPSASKKTKRYLVAAALLGGGVTLGALFSPIGLVGAQSTDDNTDDSPDTDSTANDSTANDSPDNDSPDNDRPADQRREGRRGRGGPGPRLDQLPAVLGLSPEELQEALSEGKTIAEVAQDQGIGTDELVAALVAGVEERLEAAVADGHIDDARADDRLAEIERRLEAFVTTEPGPDGFPARGHDHRRGLPGVEAEEVAELLGLTAEELRAGLTGGTSLADLAAQQGVSTDELTAFLVAEATEAIDQAVADGNVDAERAEQAKENLAERVARMIERTPGDRPDRPHDHPHRHPHEGHPDGLKPDGGVPGPEGETVESADTA